MSANTGRSLVNVDMLNCSTVWIQTSTTCTAFYNPLGRRGISSASHVLYGLAQWVSGVFLKARVIEIASSSGVLVARLRNGKDEVMSGNCLHLLPDIGGG